MTERGRRRNAFAEFARWSSAAVGSAGAFAAAILGCLLWAALGPYYRFSDAWQLVINTVTNLVTFVMVFLIQYSQNRDSMAIQLKLDELLRAVEGARTGMVELERLSDSELQHLREEFARLGERAGGIDAPPRES